MSTVELPIPPARATTLPEFATSYWAQKPLLVKNTLPSADLLRIDPIPDIRRLLLDGSLLLSLEAQVRVADGERWDLAESADAVAACSFNASPEPIPRKILPGARESRVAKASATTRGYIGT
jgi:hypothetical protein